MSAEAAKPSAPEAPVEVGGEDAVEETLAPTWGSWAQKSVKKGAAAVGKSVKKAAGTVDGKNSAVHAAR